MIDKLLNYIKENLELDNREPHVPYESLPVCILDCVYSLRARYHQVTVPILRRYAEKYMNGNKYAPGYSLSDFISHIDSVGGCQQFSRVVLKNNQKLSGRLKSEVCYEIARKLKLLNIETMDDFNEFRSIELIEIVLYSVKGIGQAALNYFFMLAGDSERCKPDVHIHRFIFNACGEKVSDLECQNLLSQAVERLNKTHKGITVRELDFIIWDKYQIQNSVFLKKN